VRGRRLILLAVALAALPASAGAFSVDQEGRNFQKTGERNQYETASPEYQQMLRERGAEREAELAGIRSSDPERSPDGLCANHMDGCAGDVRFYSWEKDGYGMRRPVLYTAASGATISGHIWATRAGPAQRPGVVITPGSVQAPEELYAYAAATLAKRGYVVMTYDVQGQGYSDQQGAAPDQDENSQAQDPNAFLDGARDSLEFFLSAPDRKYVPRKSRTSGTVHSDKQNDRVKRGLDSGFNPLWDLLDRGRIGLAGHSLGAYAVSDVGSSDSRVDAIVAWDNLAIGGGSMFGQAVPPIKPRVPALGMAADYSLTPMPNTGDPDPASKQEASRGWSKAGLDTGEIVIRGGTHYEFAYIPNPAFGATLRGMDMAAWYTAAWFDKYVKGDPTADSRLLTTRWRDDARGRQVDPNSPPDGNLFSFYHPSRLDIGLAGGGRFVCEALRKGCPGQPATDGEPAKYSYLTASMTKDSATGTGPDGSTQLPGARCVRSVSIPKRMRLARSSRRLTVRVALNSGVRAEAGLRTRSSGRHLYGRTRARLKGGARTLVVRVSRRARPGGYVATVRLGCASGKVARSAKVAVSP
jgi:dienelactone hydrolase